MPSRHADEPNGPGEAASRAWQAQGQGIEIEDDRTDVEGSRPIGGRPAYQSIRMQVSSPSTQAR